MPARLFPAPSPGHPALTAILGATPPSGCLACHINATAANGATITDHSFLFLEAQ